MCKIFLVYSSELRLQVAPIIHALEANGVEVFDPYRDIQGGDEVLEVMAENLKNSDLVVHLLSPRYLCMNESQNQDESALARLDFGNKKYVAYVLRACMAHLADGVKVEDSSPVSPGSVISKLLIALG